MNARSLNLLASATALKDGSPESFQEIVRRLTLRLAPRNPAEQAALDEICPAAWRLRRLRTLVRKTTLLELAAQPSRDDFECLGYALRALDGQDPLFHTFLQRRETRLQYIIQGALDRIHELRQTGEKSFGQNTPLEHSSGAAPSLPAAEPHHAPEP
ncbi:MAG: hypothetical protein Q8N47_14040 [Bryobacterales bacterium]|nr:hypothetical protein [Bryobacterales bacterium]